MMTHYFVVVDGMAASRVMKRKSTARRVLKRIKRKSPKAIGIVETIFR